MSRETMQPLCESKYKALAKVKSVPEAIKPLCWEAKLKEINKQIQGETAIAKAKWHHDHTIHINQMNERGMTKNSWEHMREMQDGFNGHHSMPVTMKMRMDNEELANNDKQNTQVFVKHFTTLYNTRRDYANNTARFIKQRETDRSLAEQITWVECRRAVAKLKNDKSPGENGVPPNALKALNERNSRIIYDYVCKFWNDEIDINEWRTGLVKLLPKKKDLSKTDNWTGINLMDVASKVFTSILADRAYKLLERYGTKSQFGGTPKVGCQDRQFTLKTPLHLRHQHNLHSHVIYIDLVKAYNTVNHELLFEILAKYGAPPEFVNFTSRLYSNLIVKIQIGSKREEIPQTVGVRQGEILCPGYFSSSTCLPSEKR